MNVDPLGLPVADDPGAFALAFVACTRHRDQRPVADTGPAFAENAENTDELGFPMESDPADLARSFDVAWGRAWKSERRSERPVRAR
jgi:hypothetical protein